MRTGVGLARQRRNRERMPRLRPDPLGQLGHVELLLEARHDGVEVQHVRRRGLDRPVARLHERETRQTRERHEPHAELRPYVPTRHAQHDERRRERHDEGEPHARPPQRQRANQRPEERAREYVGFGAVVRVEDPEKGGLRSRRQREERHEHRAEEPAGGPTARSWLARAPSRTPGSRRATPRKTAGVVRRSWPGTCPVATNRRASCRATARTRSRRRPECADGPALSSRDDT